MTYQTIVADPPWDHSDGFGYKLTSGSDSPIELRPLPYQTMTIEDIIELPVRSFSSRNCRLFLWTTNRWLPDSYDVMAAWGFRYAQTIVWDKPDVNPLGGSLAPNAEFLLVGRRGAPARLGKFPGPVVRINRQAHSAKPEAFLDLIESVSPGPYLELFARRQRLGWDTWGNEALCHVDLGAAS